MNQFPYLYPHSLSEVERLNEEELWQDNRDAEVSHTQLTEMFRHSDPAALMDEAEQAQLAELDDTVTVYRGVTTINSDNLLALSWTLDYSVNENMPDDDPAYQSEPDKILRYDIAGGDSFPETMISNTYAATEMTLRRFTSRGDATFHFFYDYGDGWEVVLRLEEVFEDSELPGKELPRVLEGQGFGIIEDCGGPAGLEHLREVFQQKSSPEYQSMREWLGTSEVDLSVFDLQDLNFRLKKLPRIFRDLYEYDYPPTKHSIDLLDRKYCKTN